MTKDTAPNHSPLERYFTVLETVVASGSGITLTEVANATGLPKPTAHRLLNSLCDVRVLEVDDNGRRIFQPGPRLWRILQLGANPSQMARFGQLVSREMTDILNETCYVVRYDGNRVQSIAQEISPSGYRFHVVPGDVLPFHAAATGKVVLAAQEDATIDRHLSGELTAFTPRTKTSRIDVYAELHDVRRNGYAVCDREIDEGIMAYAVPVRIGDAPVTFAVGVTGPVIRMREHDDAHFVEVLREGAAHFARLLSTSDRG